MFEMPSNPAYNMAPTTPPGLQSIPYTLGPIVAGMTGGASKPYVPPNMATFDVTMAAKINDPLYKSMMGTMYGQLGAQIGNTMGNMKFVQGLGTMAGYSPSETAKALRGGFEGFARSSMGSFVVPFVDNGLNAMGLTGGSFVAATQAAYNGRMNLMGPGLMLNPLDAGQQHQAMASAAAASTMLNAIISKRDNNNQLLLSTDQQITQGFSRERVTQLAMRAAGMGMFTTQASHGFDGSIDTGVGGLSDRLTQAVGNPDFDISRLSVGNFDGKKGGGIGRRTAQKVEAVRQEVERGIRGLTEAMGAMRDLTGTVDEELEKLLDNVTGGRWARSANGAFAARDAVRTLHAAASAYNLDPKAALHQVIANRTALQDAAGFDGSMLSLGFDGGGMFSLGAQTGLLASIEDMVNAKGVRNDPVLAGRVRKQGLQAMAKNINSVAGRGAQILAYARQIGAVSDKEASELAASLTSGDSGLMGAGLNRLLTTTFGSAEVGRRFMNDGMQMNAMRMAMNESAGKFAMTVMTNGADAEFHRREQVSAASRRLEFTQSALAESGMNTWQSPEGTGKIVADIAATIKGDGKDVTRVADAEAFMRQYDSLVAKGTDPRTAASTIVEAYKRSPATSQYAQEIDLSIKRQSAINNENALVAGGLESRQATALVRELSARGSISGSESAEIYKMVRSGDGAAALSRVEGIVGKLDSATQLQMGRVKRDAAEKHNNAIAVMKSNQEAESLLELMSGRGYGGDDIASAYEEMASAGMKYLSSDRTMEDERILWESASKSKFTAMFGNKALEEYMSAIDKGDDDYFGNMGRTASAMRQMATSNLGESGYGLQMSGYWGGGLYSGNSEIARRNRDHVITALARTWQDDASMRAEDRDSLATKVVDFMMGNKNWQSLLGVYDPKNKTGLSSVLEDYGEAYKKFEETQAAYNDSQKGYQEAIAELGKAGDYEAVSIVEKMFNSGHELDEDMLKDLLSASNSGAAQKILDAASAKNALIEAQSGTTEALSEALSSKESRGAMKSFLAFSDDEAERKNRLLKDSGVSSFVGDIDFSKEGMAYLRKASSYGGKFLDKMFDAVTDEEVAAAKGIESSAGIKEKFGDVAWSLVQKKAANGDEKAIDAVHAAKIAQRATTTRINGEITIRSGGESRPAVLEGNLGGL